MQSTIFFSLRKYFGPIRRCMEFEPYKYICAVNTPGFTKEDLETEITQNGLFMIDGNMEFPILSSKEGVITKKALVHEAIQLPPRVKLETIQWNTKNGVTVITCENTPPSYESMVVKQKEQLTLG